MKPLKWRPSLGQTNIRNCLGFLDLRLLAGASKSAVAHTGHFTSFKGLASNIVEVFETQAVQRISAAIGVLLPACRARHSPRKGFLHHFKLVIGELEG